MESVFDPPQWPSDFGRAARFLEHGVFRSPEDHGLHHSPQPRYVRRKAWGPDRRLTLNVVDGEPTLILEIKGEPMYWAAAHDSLLAKDWEAAQ